MIAITGAGGFMGAAVIERLDSLGVRSVTIDRRHGVDVLDRDALASATDGASAVIHLAGLLGTSELYDHADEAIDVNVKGALRVLEVCREQSMAYVAPTMPSVWMNLYQATKRCAKDVAMAFHEDYGVPVTHLRTYNAFGVGQACGPGHPQKIIPTFATHAWAGKPLPVWGDGLQTVDLVHVDWVAECLVAAALNERPNDDFGRGQVWDCGSGVELSVLEVAARVCRIVDVPCQVEFLPMRKGETHGTRLCATEPGPLGFGRWSSEELRDAVEFYKP